MNNELKPCPFCGGEDAISLRLAKQWKVGCTLCGADVVESTEGCITTCQVRRKRLDCVDKWNQRTESQPTIADYLQANELMLTKTKANMVSIESLKKFAGIE